MTVDRDRLLALAGDATVGPWEVMGLLRRGLGDASDVTGPHGEWVGMVNHPDAAYIAAADPFTITALVTEANADRAALEVATEALDEIVGTEWTDNALDPQRPARLSSAALARIRALMDPEEDQ